MKIARPFGAMFSVLFVLSGFLAASVPAYSKDRIHVLYRFSGDDGQSPFYGNLIFDAVGNLYGTTYQGGDQSCAYYGCGVVFELMPGPNGQWTETILHSFKDDGQDGYAPAAGVVFDPLGNLYGTTKSGGAYGGGTIFELTPGQNGLWTETVLYSFCSLSGCFDGSSPYAGLVLDAAGNLYGTTFFGGGFNLGTAFELSNDGNGNWVEGVLYHFGPTDSGPAGGLIFDPAGDLYGTTAGNLCSSGGAVFELSRIALSGWTYTLLYSFKKGTSDGACPESSLTLDAKGNLFGTTFLGGTYEGGTVFELERGKQGGWTEKILHNFEVNDGSEPYADLIFDGTGKLYGTTAYGDANGLGGVFQLEDEGRGEWTETVLHSFGGADGIYPFAGLVANATGHLYGVTYNGGNLSDCYADGCGVVFALTP